MNAVLTDNSAVAVWRRTIQPAAGDLPPAEARAMLRLKLSAEDQDRVDELAAKARLGAMTPQEDHELEDYLSVGSALEFLKSKARLSLQRSGASS
jgi:hypothetical protein